SSSERPRQPHIHLIESRKLALRAGVVHGHIDIADFRIHVRQRASVADARSEQHEEYLIRFGAEVDRYQTAVPAIVVDRPYRFDSLLAVADSYQNAIRGRFRLAVSESVEMGKYAWNYSLYIESSHEGRPVARGDSHIGVAIRRTCRDLV